MPTVLVDSSHVAAPRSKRCALPEGAGKGLSWAAAAMRQRAVMRLRAVIEARRSRTHIIGGAPPELCDKSPSLFAS
eukprot:6197674-Pleurochrysis_carterae.AAC.3